MPRNYNYIYNKLVKGGEEDIQGHIAYSLYKKEKQEWIEDWIKNNEGKEPDENDMQYFHNISGLDSSIQRYNMHAEKILNGFVADIIDMHTEDMEKDYNSKADLNLKRVLELHFKPDSRSKQFWWGCLQSVAGAFAFAIIAWIIITISAFSGANVIKALFYALLNSE